MSDVRSSCGAMVLALFIGQAVNAMDSFVPDMVVTPTMVLDGDGVQIPGSPDTFTLVWALNQTGKLGRNILLTAGTYPSFNFDSTAPPWVSGSVREIGSSSNAPVVILGEDGAVIDRISDAWGSTIGVLGHGNHTFNYIHWENIKFEASGDAAFLIGSSADALFENPYTGWSFEGCEIDGGYDWYTGTGRNSKWGILGWAVSDFSFRNGYIHDIRREHAFYMHNCLGEVWLEGNVAERCGRTFCQFTARKSEFGVGPLPENPGDIHVRDNIISDMTLGDGCEGGQAVTLVGRNRGIMWLIDNTIGFGLDPVLKDALAAQGACVPEPDGSRPIGNGAVVTWTTGSEDYETSYAMVMIGNVITYAPDAGRTSAVTLSALDYLWVSGNTIEMGLNHRALVLGQGNAAHQVPAAFVVKNNDLVQGDFMLHSLVADYCVSSNDIAGGAFFLGGAPISQPICEGAFCASCPVPCPADIGGDGTVGITDLLTLLGAWGPNPGHPADIDDNGFVGQTDLLMMLAAWGKCT